MIFGKRAQTSIEFVFILGLALTLLITSTAVFNRYSTDSQNALVNAQINKVAFEITHAAEKMHASGLAWETIEVTIPSIVKEIMIYNGTKSELVIKYERDAMSEVVFFTDLSLKNQTGFDCSTGCLLKVNPGTVELRIESNNAGEVIVKPMN